MLRDRGTKKWTSIMMPEHAKMVEQIWSESEHKDKAILDEQQLIENEMSLQEAIQNDLENEVAYFKDHDLHTAKDEVLFIKTLNSYLSLDSIDVKLDDIMEV